MDLEPEEPVGVSSEVSQAFGGGSGPISALPASTPPNVSDKPSDLMEPHVDVGSIVDVKDESHRKGDVKEDANETVVEASHNAVDEGEGTVPNLKLEQQSPPDSSTFMTSSAAGKTRDVKHNSNEAKDVKGVAEDVPMSGSHDAAEGGEKIISDYISELQSTLNSSTAEYSGIEIAQHALPVDSVGIGEEEDESVVGSLDVRLNKDQSM